ncbi:MAG: penicillin acylase family protein, partial [Lysobacter sp.]
MVKWIKRGTVALLLLVALAVLGAWWLMRGSLPALGGDLDLNGLAAPVTVQRDALGVVTIEAANESDAMRALGYVHAQERFFEMDLMRRTAAGELAELFGPRAVDTDKRRRVHRMRARVTRDLDAVAGDRLPVLQAYTDGVNAGLADLKTKPWPYLLLQAKPEPWQLEDTPLVGYAMYFDLHDADNARELGLWRIKPHVPPALFKLLRHDGSSWDAPMAGTARGDAMLPDAAQLDLRKLPTVATRGAAQLPAPMELGSNNFAVAGSLTRDGRAIVANDMHLTLRAPNIWFRVQLRYPDPRAPQGRVDIGGFTLPGLPLIVVGSNGHVAWSFTNSYGDWLDWQLQPACPAPATRGGDCPGITVATERIDVAGASPTPFKVEETTWGPIIHRNRDGSALALRWTAHLPRSLSLDLGDFAWVASLDTAVDAADRVAIPGQNLVLADRHGRIAWRLLGPMPD